jgi:hypothetical protein
MYMCVRGNVYIYMYVYIHTYIYIYVYTHTHIQTCTPTCAFIYGDLSDKRHRDTETYP